MGQVDGKVAIVTRWHVRDRRGLCNHAGARRRKVVVTDLDYTGGRAVVDKIGSAGREAVFHQDVSLSGGDRHADLDQATRLCRRARADRPA